MDASTSGIRNAQDQVSQSWDVLDNQWDLVAQVWRDEIRQRFETQYWLDYEPALQQALAQFEQFREFFARAMQELSVDD